MTEKNKILLVDDSPVNLEVLSQFLKDYDYKLLFASNGERALSVAKKIIPDMILLDIILPGMDGYQTCIELKKIDELRHVPVLFLSSLDKISDKVKGFEVGGVDYISKPFQKDELLARVKTHLELYHIREENKRYANEMELLAQKRAQALVHADRLATLGTLSAGVAHEINNPATFISVGIQTFEKFWNDVEVFLDNKNNPTPEQCEKLRYARVNTPQLISNIKSGVVRIHNVVNGLRNYAHAGKTSRDNCDINKCVLGALELCESKIKKSLVIIDQNMGSLPEVNANNQEIEQVIVNLLINAVDALEGTKEPRITISTSVEKDYVVIKVKNNGPGIPQDTFKLIWNAFYTTKPSDKGTGLGLSISKDIIENHGGRIKVENEVDIGVVFTIELPVKEN